LAILTSIIDILRSMDTWRQHDTNARHNNSLMIRAQGHDVMTLESTIIIIVIIVHVYIHA